MTSLQGVAPGLARENPDGYRIQGEVWLMKKESSEPGLRCLTGYVPHTDSPFSTPVSSTLNLPSPKTTAALRLPDILGPLLFDTMQSFEKS